MREWQKCLRWQGQGISGCGTSQSCPDLGEMGLKFQTKTLYTVCDVTKEENLAVLVNNTIKEFGKIDILVSNAGKNVFEGAEDCTQAEWENNISLNLTSHWRIATLCKPYLEQQKGIVIIMTSNHAFSSIPGCFPYNIAKTALTGLVRTLAIEWGPSIRAVGLAPGFIETSASKAWFDSFPNPDDERRNERSTSIRLRN